MSFFGMPSPSSSPQDKSSRQLLAELDKIRKSIQRGALENRAKLVSGLGVLAIVFAREGKFDESLNAFDEALELADILREEGYPDLYEELGADAFPLMSTLREAEHTHPHVKRFDRNAFYSRFEQCFDKYPQEKFEGVEVVWTRENYEQAKDLYEVTNAANPVISKLDKLIEKLEANFDWNSDHFSVWDGLMNPFHLRGICKFDIGDRNGAIADLKRYEELSAIADDVLKTGQMKSKLQVEDGKYIIRMNLDDMFDMIGCVNFRNNRFDCMARLAHLYAEKAEKENALEYYDKALEVATEKRNDKYHTVDNFGVISASAEMPFRKGHLLLLFHEYEEALKCYDESIKAIGTLLETDNEDHIDQLKSQFSECYREKSNALRNLGRFDEATEAIEQAKNGFARICREAAVRFREKVEAEEKAAQEAKLRGDDDEIDIKDIQAQLAGMFSSGGMGSDPSPVPKKRPLIPPKTSPPAPPKKKSIQDMNEKDFMLHLGVKHNEAIMDMQQGMVELQRNRYRTALKYFHKARIVMDFAVLRESFPEETTKNAFMLYFQIAVCYSDLGLHQKAEPWFLQTEKIARKLIDDGHLEYRKGLCQTLSALGAMYIYTGEWNKAVQSLEKAIKERTPLVEEFLEVIQGKDPKKVLFEENQQIMQLVEVLEQNITTRKNLVTALFQLGRIDDAIAQGRLNLESAEEMRRVFPESPLTVQRYTSAAQPLAVLMILTNQDTEAEKCLEMEVQCNLVNPHVTYEYMKAMLGKGHEIQLFDMIFDDTELKKQREEYTKALELYHDGEKDQSLETIAKVRKKFETHRLLANPHPFVAHLKNHLLEILDETAEKIRQGTWEDIEIGKDEDDEDEFDDDIFGDDVDIPESDDEVKSRIESIDKDVHNILYDRLKFEKQVDETDNEDYSFYERPADDEKVCMELIFQVFEDFGGSNLSEDYKNDPAARDRILNQFQLMRRAIVAEPVVSKTRVGRNDPCPCGSGKKYKKCCGKS